ncbi:unnamed protein product [Arctogadus glacialis]
MTLSDAIVLYFLLGLRHWEIWMFLKSEEGINISMSTLRRHLKVIGTVQEKSPVGPVALFLQEQLIQYGMLVPSFDVPKPLEY